MFTYLNDAVVHSNMATVLMDVRRELRIAERLHAQLFPGNTVRAVDSFTNWMESHFTRMHTNMDTWANIWLNRVENLWSNDPTYGPGVSAVVAVIRAQASSATVNTNGFFDPV